MTKGREVLDQLLCGGRVVNTRWPQTDQCVSAASPHHPETHETAAGIVKRGDVESLLVVDRAKENKVWKGNALRAAEIGDFVSTRDNLMNVVPTAKIARYVVVFTTNVSQQVGNSVHTLYNLPIVLVRQSDLGIQSSPDSLVLEVDDHWPHLLVNVVKMVATLLICRPTLGHKP